MGMYINTPQGKQPLDKDKNDLIHTFLSSPILLGYTEDELRAACKKNHAYFDPEIIKWLNETNLITFIDGRLILNPEVRSCYLMAMSGDVQVVTNLFMHTILEQTSDPIGDYVRIMDLFTIPADVLPLFESATRKGQEETEDSEGKIIELSEAFKKLFSLQRYTFETD